MAKPRVLLAITAYNGRDVVFSCLRSAARMAPQETDVDILVLEDPSPEPGFSEEVEAVCAELGIGYSFINSDILTSLPQRRGSKLMRDAANEWGYVVELGLLPRAMWDTNRPVVDIESREGVLVAVCHFFGVTYEIPVAPSDEILKGIVDFFGHDPSIVHTRASSRRGEPCSDTRRVGVTYERTVGYPTKV